MEIFLTYTNIQCDYEFPVDNKTVLHSGSSLILIDTKFILGKVYRKYFLNLNFNIRILYGLEKRVPLTGDMSLSDIVTIE